MKTILNMILPFKQDKPDRTPKPSLIPMALTQEAMDEYKKDREDLNNITTRRLTSIWLCKKLSITSNWHSDINSPLFCYDYINQLVCDLKNNHITANYCIPKEYCDYFLTIDPDIIKNIIYKELIYHSEVCTTHSKD